MTIFICGWSLFCVSTAVLLATALAMQFFGSYFVTKDVVVRNFTILDLELASTETEVDNILKGIIKLEPAAAAKVIRSVKSHLYSDFIFMPAAYGTIFIACMKVGWKVPEPGATFFSLLGWLQILPWISDILENIYLLGKISRLGSEDKPSFMSFHTYQWLEVLKWGLAMLGVVCALSALLYFWVSDVYMKRSLIYLVIIVIEVAIFAFLMGMFRKPGLKWKLNLGQ